MQVTVRFEAQLRLAMGIDQTTLTIDTPTTALSLFSELTNHYPEQLSSKLLDGDGHPQRSILVFINDEPLPYNRIAEQPLKPGDVITLLPPIAGG